MSRSVSLDQQIHRRRSVVLEVKVVLLLKRNLSVGTSRRSITRSKKKEIVTTTEQRKYFYFSGLVTPCLTVLEVEIVLLLLRRSLGESITRRGATTIVTTTE